MIIQVNPTSKTEIVEGILHALKWPRGDIQEGLEAFFLPRFKALLFDIVADVLLSSAGREGADQEPS